MSDPIAHNVHNPNVDGVDIPFEPNLDEYVWSAEFDIKCLRKALALKNATSSEDEDKNESLWSTDDIELVEPSPYDVSKLEAHYYYAGVGPNGSGPKLIFRTSEDIFDAPSGPKAYRRLMRVVAVPDKHDFGGNVSWDIIRDRVVVLLDQKDISFTSVDFVRFMWLDKPADQDTSNDNDDDDAKGASEHWHDDTVGGRNYTNPTIWIGVMANTLTGAGAHDSSKDIRAFLDSVYVKNIDIAYRESVYTPLCEIGNGPPLFHPVEDGSSLKDVISNVSPGFPIKGHEMTMQGTLGPYFWVGDKLYAITVRHILFEPYGGYTEYNYNPHFVSKKKVVAMGGAAFKNYLTSIKALIGSLIDVVSSLEKKILMFRAQVQDGINVDLSQKNLDEHEAELANTHAKIDDIKNLFLDIKKRWSKPRERVIGFVRWAPSFGAAVAPHRYIRDFCVIELSRTRFRSMNGNILSLGPEMSESKRKLLANERDSVPSEFKYPAKGLLSFRGILAAEQVKKPTNLNVHGDHVRRVLKCGYTTNTIGTTTRFLSFVRHYFQMGSLDFLQVAVLSNEQDSGTFSEGGDSGALIVSPTGQFLALLTGGTSNGTNTSSDITYATPFEYIWDLVKAKFPGATLCFDKHNGEFLADELPVD